ncbi:hypothetical protein BKA70DRAFT_1250837 [Coprinopsis sp. MPI-PUGE-AT-0042]|nr:hypothetical protein BKA70DRAFT_1250837 [Coprinopsis sp. MPI-PUGE-AT-0042]
MQRLRAALTAVANRVTDCALPSCYQPTIIYQVFGNLKMSPPIHLFLTTIASQPVLRKRQEYILRILQSKKIPFSSYDLASDPDAKRLWRRKAPADKQQLPGLLVGYQFVGTFDAFEDAVEHDELDIFLKLKEPWDPAIDEERPPPEVKAVGVPGANLPMEMTPKHIKEYIIAEQSSPLRVKSKTKPIPVNKLDEKDQIDLGNELAGYGLQGVKVTQDELMDLMGQLGLGGEEADDLAKGLVGASSGSKKEKQISEEKKVEEASKAPEDTKGKAKAVEIASEEVKAPIPAKVEGTEPTPVTKAEEVKATPPAEEKGPVDAKEELKEEGNVPNAPAPTPAETETK